MTERTFTQAQVNAMVANERRTVEAKYSGFDDYKSKAAQLDELTKPLDDAQDNDQTVSSDGELDDVTADDLAAIEYKNQTLRTQLLRQEISATNHLDPDLWDRVTGDTAEDIEADVKKLVEKFGNSRGGSNFRQSRQMQSGASQPPDMRTAKQKAADAIRGASRSGALSTRW